MAKYSGKATRRIAKVLHEFKEGELLDGSNGKPVRDRKQALAIGLSEARRGGAGVPSRRRT